MQARLTNRPVAQVIAAIQALDLDPIRLRVMDAELGEGWTREHAESVERAYRNYLTMLAKHPGDIEDIAVSKDVDEFWHTHILHTMKYMEDCEKVFGTYLHHAPKTNAEKSTAMCAAAIRAGNVAMCAVAIRAKNAAMCAAAIRPENTTMCAAAVRAENAAMCAAAIRAENVAMCAAAIRAKNAAMCAAAIRPENTTMCAAAVRAENAAMCAAAIRAEDTAMCAAAVRLESTTMAA